MKKVRDTQKNQPPLYIVFKYLAVGSGIIGIGFAIAIAGLLLTNIANQ